jgi:superoxide reductase
MKERFIMRFFKCNICKKVILELQDGAPDTICCGESMKELIPGEVDGAVEKHVPVVTVNNSIVHVEVGEVIHPSEEKHYIEFIALETTKGCKIVKLNPGDKPVADFALLDGEKALTCYELCNLHGLWKVDL